MIVEDGMCCGGQCERETICNGKGPREEERVVGLICPKNGD
jgi:hypothetical protein